MTKDEKTQFIKDLMFNMEMSFKHAVDKMPENWSGKQIRQYMVDRFSSEVVHFKMSRQERKDYENDVVNSMF